MCRDRIALSTVAEYDASIDGRVLDFQFVLDELQNLNTGDPRLSGRLDLDRIGAFGWSIGGATAAQLCLRDSRCKAGAGMDGSLFETNLLTQPLNVPYMLLRCGAGPDPNPGNGLPDGRPDDRWEFYNEQLTNAYWVKLASTVHGDFSDPGLIVDSTSLGWWGTPMSGGFLPGSRVSQIVRAYLLSFFNKFLLGKDDHLLDGPSPAYPEVLQFLSTSRVSVPPQYPVAGLVQGSDGSLYGTTAYGGESGQGTVFQVTTNGVLTTLASFNGTNGSQPVAALVQGSDGSFYGTTAYGGASGNHGTVFEISPGGVLTTLASFSGTNGDHPFAGLVQGGDGNFYGTTILGGANNLGTVFQVTSSGVLTTLVSFNGTNGSAPFAPLALGTNGNFYGIASAGGPSASGTVFEITTTGVLNTRANSSGYAAAGGLTQGSNGLIYGTTAYGGNTSLNAGAGFGTVFGMPSSGAPTTLVSFGGANGSYCVSGLVRGSDGNFYGTTAGGGANGGGTVFKLTPSGVLTTLVSFNGANGNSPQASLIQASDGNLYGTTAYGGPNGGGTVFRVTTSGLLTTLVAF